MRRIPLPPELNARTCNYCDSPLVRREREAPKLWVARKFCSNKCLGRAKTVDRTVRFWARVERRGPSECWPWTGLRSSRGYGLFSTSGKNYRAHRLALEMSGTQVPPDRLVMHSCDNPPCCNPAHLSVGTAMDNNRDMMAKGRDRRLFGADNPNSKISADQKTAIRARKGERLADVAKDYGVSRTTICRIQGQRP